MVNNDRVGPLYEHIFPPSLAPSLSFIGIPKQVHLSYRSNYMFQINFVPSSNNTIWNRRSRDAWNRSENQNIHDILKFKPKSERKELEKLEESTATI